MVGRQSVKGRFNEGLYRGESANDCSHRLAHLGGTLYLLDAQVEVRKRGSERPKIRTPMEHMYGIQTLKGPYRASNCVTGKTIQMF